ncbi:MAG: tetratricopeptide repeat protein, partial [Bacteroidota bacterium]
MGQYFSKILLLIFFCLPFLASSNSVTDSLENLLKKNIKLDTNRVNILNSLGFEYWIIDPNKSEKYGIQSLDLASILKYEKGEAYAHRIIGVAHWARGNYDPALDHLLRAFNIYSSINDALGAANTNLNIGMVYGDQKDYLKALEYFDNSILEFKKLNKEDRVATAFTKIGDIYTGLKNYDEAYDYFDRALKIHERNKFIYGQAEANNRLGILFTLKGDLDKALSYLFRSLEAGEKRSDQHGLVANFAQIGHVYLMKKDFAQAETYLLKGKLLGEEINVKKTLKDIYENLKNLEMAKGNPDQALAYFQLYNNIRDSLFNEEMALQMSNLRSQNELKLQRQQLKLKEQDIALLQAQNRNSTILIVTAFLAVLLLGMLATHFFIRQRDKNQKALSQEIKLRESKESLLADEQAKTKELTQELSQRNKELTAYTVNFIRKNELITEIRKTLKDLKQSPDKSIGQKLNALEKQLNSAFNIDEDWESFRFYFEEVHPSFFPTMKKTHADLSSNDLKLCILARMNLSSKEMATMLGISPDSVKTARYRLRRKLGLERQDSILDYLIALEQAEGI